MQQGLQHSGGPYFAHAEPQERPTAAAAAAATTAEWTQQQQQQPR